jgi:hypothetical protein
MDFDVGAGTDGVTFGGKFFFQTLKNKNHLFNYY